MTRTQRTYDIIVYGATGYTGRLVAEYLTHHYAGRTDGPRWAMAGRNAEKLADVRDLIGAPANTPLFVADADNPDSLKAMAEATHVVLTTVGPYQLYGEPLVAACVAAGTDYVDLCGEPAWMAEMIAKYDETARASGARITFSCGFDSIPFDLGVLMLQNHAREHHGAPAPRVKGRVRSMVGKFSGGTAASLRATMDAAGRDPSVIQRLMDPFALTPGFTGPAQPPAMAPEEDASLNSWAAPFIMATINTKNVHRTNFLLDHAHGRDLVYDEMILTGPGEQGKAAAKYVAETPMIGTPNDPKPGEGPTKEERDGGSYDIVFVGEFPDGRRCAVSVGGNEDPGYGSTSKMIAETAILLANDDSAPGGVTTPGAVGGTELIDRLVKEAGLRFQVEQ